MKSRSCGLVQRIGTPDSAAPHPDPCGGQAPALHFLIPPSTIGLKIGTFRRWRAGIEVDWRAHPGSESGTCFHSNCSCRQPPAHHGMKMGPGCWGCLGVVGATLPLWIPASARMTNLVAGDNYFRTNRPCRQPPAHHGMKTVALIGGVACAGHLPPIHRPWIPAFAGMTNGGVCWRTRKPFKSIFVRMTTCGLRTIEMTLVC